MKILHTEASPGWGGQEIRILKEAIGMRRRGHEILFAVQRGGGLVEHARKEGFQVYEIPYRKRSSPKAFFQLLGIIWKHKIDIVNTHSSFDAWTAGVLCKIIRVPVIRTRHLSTPIKKGFNSRVLYNLLADMVVTTCQSIVEVIVTQAKLPQKRCLSIPTGVNPIDLDIDLKKVLEFKKSLGIKQGEVVAGTVCVLRGWKGISDLLYAAKFLETTENLKWLIVGGGVSEEHFKNQWRALKLEDKVIFTGHLKNPKIALAAIDIFLLLSWAHEGVSQASLQAAWLKKPLVTTPTGGLKEVCLDGKTGFQVKIHSPEEVSNRVQDFLNAPSLRKKMGEEAHQLVKENFTYDRMLDQMEKVYSQVRR